MSEALIRNEPVPATVFQGEGVALRAAPPMARYSLRARQPADLSAALGGAVPEKIGAVASGLACLGPDEWLMLAAEGTQCLIAPAHKVSVTDVSDRSIGLILEGPRAAEVLAFGCPLDFDHFAVGRATRTIYEVVEIVVLRESPDRFHIEVWRSFAPWLWTALTSSSH